MYHDEIIEEVWKNRDQYVKEQNHDLKSMITDLQQRQSKHIATVDRRKMIDSLNKSSEKKI